MNKIIRLLSGLIAALLFLTLLAGCASQDPVSTKETVAEPDAEGFIVIGMANPMTGDNAWLGETKTNSAKLAVEAINEAGGINGRLIKLDIQDDQGNPTVATSMAKKMCANPDMVAALSHWNSSAALAALATYTENKMPLISDSASTQLANASPYYFRVGMTDEQQGRQMAQFMIENERLSKIAVMYPNNDFGIGLTDAFSDEIKKLGGEIVASESYFEGVSKDFTPQLTIIREKQPDAIFLSGYYTEAALIAQQAKESLSMNVPFYSGDGVNSPDLIALGGDSVEGMIFAGYFHPDSDREGVAEFVEKYTARYGIEPDSYGAMCYDMVNVLFEVMRNYGTTRAEIQKGLREIKYSGITGDIGWHESGDNDRQLVILTIKDGEIAMNDVQFDPQD